MQSNHFNARLLAESPGRLPSSRVRRHWKEPEEGEVTGGANVVENVVVLDEPEAEGDQARAEAVFLRIDPSPTLVDVQHWGLSPWFGDLWSVGSAGANFKVGPARTPPVVGWGSVGTNFKVEPARTPLMVGWGIP
ncbi:hypothetical protein TIFTF001_032896 [Ficus carica]|uniref:Uncharacterized protein n=1 Tax=Ficus carica TaxID=3494 RepID=A0AA88DXJ1_FICCA|nr:hypothetical protein TIFTF001_032896 [Ficus carica]